MLFCEEILVEGVRLQEESVLFVFWVGGDSEIVQGKILYF